MRPFPTLLLSRPAATHFFLAPIPLNTYECNWASRDPAYHRNHSKTLVRPDVNRKNKPPALFAGMTPNFSAEYNPPVLYFLHWVIKKDQHSSPYIPSRNALWITLETPIEVS